MNVFYGTVCCISLEINLLNSSFESLLIRKGVPNVVYNMDFVLYNILKLFLLS